MGRFQEGLPHFRGVRMTFVEPHFPGIRGEIVSKLELGSTFLSKIFIGLALVQGHQRATLADGEALGKNECQLFPLRSSDPECPVEPGFLRAP